MLTQVVPEGQVLVYDGVGMLFRGDVCVIVYQKAARLERTRWLFDVVENFLAGTDTDLLAFMLVLPSADPPDAETRQENTDRMRRLGPRIRRLVTTPIGNAFKVNVVRAIMRGLNVVLGNRDKQFIADTVDQGLMRLLEATSERTPTIQQMRADIAAIYRELGESEPRFPTIPPGTRNSEG